MGVSFIPARSRAAALCAAAAAAAEAAYGRKTICKLKDDGLPRSVHLLIFEGLGFSGEPARSKLQGCIHPLFGPVFSLMSVSRLHTITFFSGKQRCLSSCGKGTWTSSGGQLFPLLQGWRSKHQGPSKLPPSKLPPPEIVAYWGVSSHHSRLHKASLNPCFWRELFCWGWLRGFMKTSTCQCMWIKHFQSQWEWSDIELRRRASWKIHTLLIIQKKHIKPKKMGDVPENQLFLPDDFFWGKKNNRHHPETPHWDVGLGRTSLDREVTLSWEWKSPTCQWGRRILPRLRCRRWWIPCSRKKNSFSLWKLWTARKPKKKSPVLKRNIIWTKASFLGFNMLIFRGVPEISSGCNDSDMTLYWQRK